ncbi:hypothetical protein D1631_05160 [Chryseobacterium nematophagum]|uniref:T9SS C-terminal target domain-containing protein n=1 Tax=Chryseobacterium nematophagum TaxID=2305228 RepID=A0A3M7TE75_9FLAO|nr:hypothetical protein [Chryseobacterium nematophagum]RNA61364.1 hypothetical protein D1631_05160 [Chryseobacterium nematophagum]
MVRTLLLSVFLVWSCSPKAQDSPHNETLVKEFSLPKKLKEVSGITLSQDKKIIWAIEDQGNKNVIYGIDFKGNIIKDVIVEDVENNDWEDITSDPQGNLYIGDFGNNDNNRQNLAILKVDLKDASQNTTKMSQTTKFHYQGQTEFPPKKSNWLYDCEAFIQMNDSFYLFTKNRSKGFDGTFLVFRIPNKEGDFEAKLIGKLKLQGGYNDAAITSACLNAKGDKIVLLTHKNIHILSGFTDNDFNSVAIHKISLNHHSQKEAITFLNDETLLIADEKDKKMGGNVYGFSF